MLKKLAALTLPLALFPLSAGAEVIKWKDVSGWDISYYDSNTGCLAYTSYEKGTGFFIGFNLVDGEYLLDITLMDKAWASIEDGKSYKIKAYFGDETPWDLEMTGRDYGGTPGLTGNFSLADAELLIEEFQRELAMEWLYAGNSLGRFTLRGSRAAFQEVLNCQKSYLDAVSGGRDPFAGATRTSDPFAN